MIGLSKHTIFGVYCNCKLDLEIKYVFRVFTDSAYQKYTENEKYIQNINNTFQAYY